jgi:hypothetical protein
MECRNDEKEERYLVSGKEIRGWMGASRFNDRVEWVRGYLMPERNYRVGVSYTF